MSTWNKVRYIKVRGCHIEPWLGQQKILLILSPELYQFAWFGTSVVVSVDVLFSWNRTIKI